MALVTVVLGLESLSGAAASLWPKHERVVAVRKQAQVTPGGWVLRVGRAEDERDEAGVCVWHTRSVQQTHPQPWVQKTGTQVTALQKCVTL